MKRLQKRKIRKIMKKTKLYKKIRRIRILKFMLKALRKLRTFAGLSAAAGIALYIFNSKKERIGRFLRLLSNKHRDDPT